MIMIDNIKKKAQIHQFRDLPPIDLLNNYWIDQIIYNCQELGLCIQQSENIKLLYHVIKNRKLEQIDKNLMRKW